MVLLWLLACGPTDRDVHFPDVLTPLEPDNLAPERSISQGEGFDVVSGTDEGWVWAHARGLVHAPSADAWRALREPLVHIDRRALDSWHVDHDVHPDFADSFQVENTIQVLITMSWDVLYVFEAQDGTDAAPQRAMAMWDVAQAPDTIDVLRGSAVLRSVDPMWTEVELIYHLQAPTQDADAVALLLSDITEDWLAATHSRSLPAFE